MWLCKDIAGKLKECADPQTYFRLLCVSKIFYPENIKTRIRKLEEWLKIYNDMNIVRPWHNNEFDDILYGDWRGRKHTAYAYFLKKNHQMYLRIPNDVRKRMLEKDWTSFKTRFKIYKTNVNEYEKNIKFKNTLQTHLKFHHIRKNIQNMSCGDPIVIHSKMIGDTRFI